MKRKSATERRPGGIAAYSNLSFEQNNNAQHFLAEMPQLISAFHIYLNPLPTAKVSNRFSLDQKHEEPYLDTIIFQHKNIGHEMKHQIIRVSQNLHRQSMKMTWDDI